MISVIMTLLLILFVAIFLKFHQGYDSEETSCAKASHQYKREGFSSVCLFALTVPWFLDF